MFEAEQLSLVEDRHAYNSPPDHSPYSRIILVVGSSNTVILAAISLQLDGTVSLRTAASSIALRRTTDTPALVNAALFWKFAYSSGSLRDRTTSQLCQSLTIAIAEAARRGNQRRIFARRDSRLVEGVVAEGGLVVDDVRSPELSDRAHDGPALGLEESAVLR